MSARIACLPGVEPQPTAGEVEHREGVVGALAVGVEDSVPTVAARAADVRTGLEAGRVGRHVPPSIARVQDSAGHAPWQVLVRRRSLHRVDH